jgi:hypothetical protein
MEPSMCLRTLAAEVVSMGVEVRTEEGPVRVGTEECFQHP